MKKMGLLRLQSKKELNKESTTQILLLIGDQSQGQQGSEKSMEILEF